MTSVKLIVASFIVIYLLEITDAFTCTSKGNFCDDDDRVRCSTKCTRYKHAVGRGKGECYEYTYYVYSSFKCAYGCSSGSCNPEPCIDVHWNNTNWCGNGNIIDPFPTPKYTHFPKIIVEDDAARQFYQDMLNITNTFANFTTNALLESEINSCLNYYKKFSCSGTLWECDQSKSNGITLDRCISDCEAALACTKELDEFVKNDTVALFSEEWIDYVELDDSSWPTCSTWCGMPLPSPSSTLGVTSLISTYFMVLLIVLVGFLVL